MTSPGRFGSAIDNIEKHPDKPLLIAYMTQKEHGGVVAWDGVLMWFPTGVDPIRWLIRKRLSRRLRRAKYNLSHPLRLIRRACF